MAPVACSVLITEGSWLLEVLAGVVIGFAQTVLDTLMQKWLLLILPSCSAKTRLDPSFQHMVFGALELWISFAC